MGMKPVQLIGKNFFDAGFSRSSLRKLRQDNPGGILGGERVANLMM